MRKIFGLVLFISVNVFGQNPPGYQSRTVRERIQGSFMVDSGLHIPRYCGVPSGVRGGVSVQDGAIAMDTCNNRFYIYSSGAWLGLASFSETATRFGKLGEDVRFGEDRTPSGIGTYGLKIDSLADFWVGFKTSSSKTVTFFDYVSGKTRFLLDATKSALYSPNQATNLRIYDDTAFIALQSTSSKLLVTNLASGAGTKSLRYNPSDGRITYADTTGSTPTLQQVITAGNILTTNNTIDADIYTLSVETDETTPFKLIRNTASASASVAGLAINRGGANGGTGTGIHTSYLAKNASGSNVEIGRTDFRFLDATAGAEQTYFMPTLLNSGAITNHFVFYGDGNATFDGLPNGGVTADSLMVVTSSGVIKKRDAASLGGGSGWSLSGNSLTAGSQTGSFIGSTNNVSMRFRTNNTQRMIIDSNGTVLINKASAYTSGGDGLIIHGLNSSAFNYGLMVEDASSNGLFYVQNNGTITFGGFTTTMWGSSSVVDMSAATVSATNINFAGYAQHAEISTPSTPSSGFGRYYEKSDNLPYFINDAGTELRLSPQSLNKGAFIASPTSADTIDVWQTPVAITITSLKTILRGSSSPSVTFNIGFGTNIQSPTAVFTSDITCTSITTGCSNSSGFNDATIPAGSFIWIYTNAQSGTVRSIAFTINYTED